MTTQQKICAILKQENYRVENGKVLRYDQLDEKFKPVIVSGNRIPLVKTGSVVEIFMWDDVAACIKELNGAAKKNDVVDDLPFKIVEDNSNPDITTIITANLTAKDGMKLKEKKISKPKKQIMAKKKKSETKPKTNRKPSVNLTEEHIAIIKKEHNKGTSKMAIARLLSEKTGMDVTRFIVMYHVKKIDAKKK